jgi:uncharacterized protein YecE (DUF72 family)
MSDAKIHLGSSSFTASGWQGAFYPKGLKSSDYLSFYSEHFDTVEVDSTFYGFVFSVKAPQSITHDKVLVNCDAEIKEFLDTISILGEKLGPIVFQFPYFDNSQMRDALAFTDRLIPFLNKLPKNYRFAVEIRNRKWLDAELADLLRTLKIALVLQDIRSMPGPQELKFDPVTADWTYIRWLGDRKGIEAVTQTWDRIVEDKTARLSSWVDYCQRIQRRGVKQYIYANNHYEGFSVATVEKFRNIWRGRGFPELDKPLRIRPKEPSLFER